MTAKAPKPGAGKRIAAHAEAQTEMVIRLKDDTYRFTPSNIPFAIRAKVRKSTGGLPFAAYWNGEQAIDVDSLMVCVWVARMMGGEDTLTMDEVEADWPADISGDDLDVEIIEPGDDTDEDADPNG